MKTILFICSFLFFMTANGQLSDTSQNKIPASWKRFHLAPRVALGAQKAFFLETGLSYQRYVYARNGFVVYNLYSSFEWTPSSDTGKAITGAKLGYESVFNGGAGAIEVKYLTNGDIDDIMITPKIGFGIGAVNIFYGYNFSTDKYPFTRVRKHQFSLVFNTNILFYQNKYEKK